MNDVNGLDVGGGVYEDCPVAHTANRFSPIRTSANLSGKASYLRLKSLGMQFRDSIFATIHFAGLTGQGFSSQVALTAPAFLT
jgi:hypothetical protein